VFLSSWVARVSPEPAARHAAAGRVKVEAVVDDDGFEWAGAAALVLGGTRSMLHNSPGRLARNLI
jgi:hypothetical protein